MVLVKQALSVFLSYTLAFSVIAQSAQTVPATASSQPSPAELQQLVAPIALYPDALVAQILAAATYPTQVVEADRWVQQNANLKGSALTSAVDKQSWDPSVKGLTQFPSALDNMSKNLSWTSSLGDAYYNIPNDVMQAIQVLRKEAQQAGNLNSTPQQTVTSEGQTIVIQPANPEVVYVPTYSPDYVYGAPIAPYPGYSGWDVAAASAISFGVGTAVGAAFGGAWGWNAWGANWHGGNVVYNHNTYVSRSNTFANRNTTFSQFNRNAANANRINRGTTNLNQFNRSTGNLNQVDRNAVNRGQFNRNTPDTNRQNPNLGSGTQQSNRERQDFNASRGFGQADRSSLGAQSGAFGGFSQGGAARMESSRGSSSFGGSRGGAGGGGFGGGGGGFRGGGGRRR
jgi:uncharacterized membrane protein YgcG